MIKVSELIKDEKVFKSDKLIEKPEISVILPTYCRGDDGLLKNAIDSVLSQNYENFELIIVDDGSVDGTQELVKSYLKIDNRIIYIRNDKNSGLPAVRCNQAYLHSRGKYICFQFDDDSWRPNALADLYSAIYAKAGELCLVYGAAMIHDLSTGAEYKFFEKYSYSALISQNRIANNTVIFPRALSEKYGLYDCHLLMRRLCDWDLWVRYAGHVNFYAMDKIVSDVVLYCDNSLGKTCDYDLQNTRLMMNYDRNQMLTPRLICDYEIDYIPDFLTESEKNQLYNRHILPWLSKHGDYYNSDDIHYSAFKYRRRLIITKNSYDSTVDIMIKNFLKLLENDYYYLFVPEEQLEEFVFCKYDVLILCRATSSKTLKIVETNSIPVIYFIDDDLLNIYKLGLEYIKPGTEMYLTVEKLLASSDLVVTFSDSITNTVKKYNKKVYQLKTNISSEDVCGSDYYEDDTFKIFFAGGNARKDEFEQISDDLVSLSKIYGSKIEFEFWGYIPEKLIDLETSRVTYREFNDSYRTYIENLKNQHFNLLICPLKDTEYNRAKSPIKFLESVVCGAIGLFSEMSVYSEITDGKNGFTITDGESWQEKISSIIEMSLEKKKEIYSEALNYIISNYITEKQLEKFKHILECAFLSNSIGDGNALYLAHSPYYAGAESVILKQALLLAEEGFNIKFGLPKCFESMDEELQNRLKESGIDVIYFNYHSYTDVNTFQAEKIINSVGQTIEILNKEKISMVHYVTFIPSVSYACFLKGIPCVANLYQCDDINARLYIKKFLPTAICSDANGTLSTWITKFHVPGLCIRNYVEKTSLISEGKEIKDGVNIAIIGTIQPRKGQLTAIKAISEMSSNGDINLFLYGYDKFFAEYVDECKSFINSNNLKNIHIRGFYKDVFTQLNEDNINILLCASTEESLPQSILEGMALGIPVVSTPVGYVEEAIGGGKGFIAKGFNEKDLVEAIEECIKEYRSKDIYKRIYEAQIFIRDNCSKENVTKALCTLYNMCFEQLDIIGTSNIGAFYKTVETNDDSYKSVSRRVIDSSVLRPSRKLKNKKYYICSKKQSITGIAVIFSNTEKEFNDGYIQLKLNYKGKNIRTCNVLLSSIQSDNWCEFVFDEITNCSNKCFELIFSVYYGNSRPSKDDIIIYEYIPNVSVKYKILNKLQIDSKSKDVLYYELI